MRAVIAILTLTIPAGYLLAADDSEPPALMNNPFSRPPSEKIVAQETPSIIGIEPVEKMSLELQATMIGTATKFANVEGRILKRGDEIHGYTLVAIHERYAVFERDGRQTAVYVRPVQTEEQTSPGRRR